MTNEEKQELADAVYRAHDLFSAHIQNALNAGLRVRVTGVEVGSEFENVILDAIGVTVCDDITPSYRETQS